LSSEAVSLGESGETTALEAATLESGRLTERAGSLAAFSILTCGRPDIDVPDAGTAEALGSDDGPSFAKALGNPNCPTANKPAAQTKVSQTQFFKRMAY
jgi:hypothetical protein